MDFQKLLSISRPRFWMYTVGPFLIGIAATGGVFTFPAMIQELSASAGSKEYIGLIVLFLIFLVYVRYFLFPANLLIYGVNDIADGDTDQFNEKKQGYESQLNVPSKTLQHSIVRRGIYTGLIVCILIFAFVINEHYPRTELPAMFAGILPSRQTQAGFSLVIFLHHFLQTVPFWIAFFFFSIFYSVRPVRAKSKPFIDGIFNVLYIIPGLIGYITFGGASSDISWVGFGVGRLWCIAMHTYSAIPDIEPDRQAGLMTTAVFLGKKQTLLYCGLIRLLASIGGSFVIGPISYLFGVVYLSLIGISTYIDVMTVYRWFPWINATIGFILFWIIALP